MLILFITSCNINKKNSIDKLILVCINDLTWDSINNAHLGICYYIEYSRDSVRFVTKNKKNLQSIQNFLVLKNSDSTNQIIEQTLLNKTYKDEYYEEGEGIYYVLIYRFSGKFKQIIFDNYSAPKEILKLKSYLYTLIKDKNTQSTKMFFFDNLFYNFEKDLFKKFPPPPPPSPLIE